MKRTLLVLFVLLITVSLAMAKGQKEEGSKAAEASGYEDGIYFAQQDGFSEHTGWKYMVTLLVEDGEIVEAEWNGAHTAAGNDKITRSESGEYGMVENGGAQAPWYEQAAKAEKFLLENQDPTAITYSDDEGHTDAISGVTIHVVEFFDLAEKALKKGPVGYGMWEDGAYHAEADEFSNGWRSFVDLTVVSGYIVSAEWNAYPEEGEKLKKQTSKDGEYGMVANSDAQWPWWEQAENAEAYLLETQDPSKISYSNDEGNTDAISGVTIHVKDFFSLAQEALEGAKR